MSHFLVTGGAGFIGSHVVDALIAEGHQVRVIDNLVNGRKEQVNQTAEFVQGDITDLSVVNAVMQGIDGVFHLAALPRVPYTVEFPLESAKVNITGTLNVFESARQHKVKRVVMSSTSAIYGNSTKDHQSPQDPIELLSPYSLQKYVGEQLAQQYSRIYNLETVCLRYFNVFGPRMDDEGGYGSVIAIFRKQQAHGKPLTIEGDGSQRRDFIFVSDVVRANLLAMQSTNVGSGEVLNVGTGASMSVQAIAELFGGPIEHRPARPNDVKETSADISVTTATLGWTPRVSFQDGLKELLAKNV